jgi:hypothetical protein
MEDVGIHIYWPFGIPILWSIGILVGILAFIFPVLLYCAKKNLAILVCTSA